MTGYHAQLADMADQLNHHLPILVAELATYGVHLETPQAAVEVDTGYWQPRLWRAADHLAALPVSGNEWWRVGCVEHAAREWVSAATQYGVYAGLGAPWVVRDFRVHMGQVVAFVGRLEATRPGGTHHRV